MSEDGSETIASDDYYYDEIEGNLYNSQFEEYIKNIRNNRTIYCYNFINYCN